MHQIKHFFDALAAFIVAISWTSFFNNLSLGLTIISTSLAIAWYIIRFREWYKLSKGK